MVWALPTAGVALTPCGSLLNAVSFFVNSAITFAGVIMVHFLVQETGHNKASESSTQEPLLPSATGGDGNAKQLHRSQEDLRIPVTIPSGKLWDPQASQNSEGAPEF